MLYLLSTFWFWLLLALSVGFATGWLTFARSPGNFWRGLAPWGLALGLGALVAVLQLLPQRIGYWLDLGVLMLAAYLLGCCLASIIRLRLGDAAATEPAAMSGNIPTPGNIGAAGRIMPPPLAVEVAVEPTKPAPAEAVEEAITGLSAARAGKPDDLTQIYGIDGETQKKLNDLGLYHYDQLASLTPGNRRWLFRQLGHAGRFPSWWWRWRYDAEQLVAGKSVSASSPPKAAKPKSESKSSAVKPAKIETAPVAAPPAAPLAVVETPSQEGFEGSKPAGLATPRGGKADDLKRISGIGKQNEGRLHGLGIWHFDQIAQWSADEVKWVGGFLAFPGRIEREEWVRQAKVLGEGGETEFSRRADAGLVESSRDDTQDDGQGNVIPLGEVVKKPGAKAPKK